jgi:hypothetical protein
MKNSKPAVRIVAWILLLFASTVQMATTPLDVGCIVMVIVDFTKWKKSKQG